jgi:transposase
MATDTVASLAQSSRTGCDLYRLWAKRLRPPMRLAHKAGEKMFLDYPGQTMPVVDLQTGEIRQAHLFVAVLGASSYASGRAAGYTYAEAQGGICPTGSAATCGRRPSSAGSQRSSPQTTSRPG